ncbi:hypothetical protein A2Z53_00785 [Candidatus Giovannonibacteria bacterium RIFCSPHIGHO2_02_42_15]|uniref:Uncharacterized protein n=2 Tax=Candidatus Giovannoniibacteriota TaxID=1752738 RepID=A0A1F5VM43_9BACT|nr:MAG: hypothetical protein UV11_C0020G0006 [Candidatus Giovannonibacteria bacterium GW2011_GWF2_42_19]OGF64318.1 MAG: hypothetical protein A2Z53_00785 [Candidatus Giovannonibacteria bacterium RIFCSPHIGHO2_02_42_15]
MRQYRLVLLRKEFPFLDEVAAKLQLDLAEDVHGISIEKGDRNLLSQKGKEDSYSWGGGGHHDYTSYFAVWTEGEEKRIYELRNEGFSATGSGERHEWDADTIGEQLFAQNIVPDFIVECEKNDHDDNGNGEVTRYWTIHKMSKFNLSGYHQERIDEAAAVIKAEIAAACAEEVGHER